MAAVKTTPPPAQGTIVKKGGYLLSCQYEITGAAGQLGSTRTLL